MLTYFGYMPNCQKSIDVGNISSHQDDNDKESFVDHGEKSNDIRSNTRSRI